MADTVTSQKLLDGQRNVVYKFTNESDGTGETNVVKVDMSSLSGNSGEVAIQRIHYDISGMDVELLWDATTDVRAVKLASGNDTKDFTKFGGLINNAGTGKTGDILLTTYSASAGDSYTIELELTKRG